MGHAGFCPSALVSLSSSNLAAKVQNEAMQSQRTLLEMTPAQKLEGGGVIMLGARLRACFLCFFFLGGGGNWYALDAKATVGSFWGLLVMLLLCLLVFS